MTTVDMSRRCHLTGPEIHVWQLRTHAPTEACLNQLRALLSPEERNRADRFRFEHLRHAFLLRRGVLRLLLTRYLGTVSPQELSFDHVSNGKPVVAGIEFNTSRTNGLAVFAFTCSGELGVDVEHIRPVEDRHAIAQRFFCAEEAAELRSLPEASQDLAFHLCWTRKEAYIKAIGEGLSAPLDAFRVTLRPGEAAKFLHIQHDPALASEWSLHNLEVTQGFAGALAYHDKERPLTVFPPITAEDLAGVG